MNMGSMDGKVCLVTGATSGIGYTTALELAQLGARVVLVGRNPAKSAAAVKSIQAKTGKLSVEYLQADLSSQAQIHNLASSFYEHHDCLDVLVNNAGGFFLFRKNSVDGIEMTFAVNHLAYFLLTLLLLDALKASQAARIINVSSGNHFHEHLDFDDLQLKKSYNPLHAYGLSKLANILFTYELARRLKDTHITANALTPGMVATDIWKKVNPILTPVLYPLVRLVGQTPLEGAQTSIYLASSPEVSGVSGEYFANKHPIPSGPATFDLDAASRLWQVSLELVGMAGSPV